MLNNPTLYAHLTKTHETNVYLIHEHADTSGRRKRKRPGVLDPAHEVPIVTAFQKTLDSIQLKSWQCVLDLIFLEFETNAVADFFLTLLFSCVHLRTQIKMCLLPSRNHHHSSPHPHPIPPSPLTPKRRWYLWQFTTVFLGVTTSSPAAHSMLFWHLKPSATYLKRFLVRLMNSQ